MKQKYKLAAEKFNNKPLKPDWIRFAMDLGLLEPSPVPAPVPYIASTAAPAPAQVAAASVQSDSSPGTRHTKALPAAAPGSAAAIAPIDGKGKEVAGTAVLAAAVAKKDDVQEMKAEVRETSTGMDAAALAGFLRRTPGLGKTQIGEYISKGPADLYPFHALVLKEYVRTFDFSGR